MFVICILVSMILKHPQNFNSQSEVSNSFPCTLTFLCPICENVFESINIILPFSCLKFVCEHVTKAPTTNMW